MIGRRGLLASIAALALAPGLARAADMRRRLVGGVTRIDPRLDAVIDPAARPEVLATGYGWAEGPVWSARGDYLLFSDVPGNTVWRWSEAGSASRFLQPSGLAGSVPEGIGEPGANGLALDRQGRLVMADSGARAIARVDLATRRKTILVDRFEGKRFNSPNDLAVARSGAIYFTDPPYGLKGGLSSPLREMDYQGVYRLDPDGKLRLLDRALSLPNGIALSPDERTLFVTLSDEKRPEILAYPLGPEGMPSGDPRLFYDAQPRMAPDAPGVPDGIKVDASGRMFATGPGGVHVLTSAGELLGVIGTGKAVANCAIGGDGRWLFLTSDDMLARVALRS